MTLGIRITCDRSIYSPDFPLGEADPVPVEEVLYVLEHDGYLARLSGGYRFVSGLLEDWWRLRHGGWWCAQHDGRPGSLD